MKPIQWRTEKFKGHPAYKAERGVLKMVVMRMGVKDTANPWNVYVDGECIGYKPTLELAKRLAEDAAMMLEMKEIAR